jgi:hypothetical protein
VAIGVLVAATASAARKFVLDHHRAMRRSEQLRFALLAFTALILIALIQLALTVLIIIGKDELPALLAEVQAWAADNAGLLSFVIAVVALVCFGLFVGMALAAVRQAARYDGKNLTRRLSPARHGVLMTAA